MCCVLFLCARCVCVISTVFTFSESSRSKENEFGMPAFCVGAKLNRNPH